MNSTESSPQKKTLTDLLRVYTAGMIDPIVTVLARLKISPDWLTISGMLFHGLFAWLIATDRLPLAGLLMVLLVPLDSLDGALARKLKRPAGGFGAFLDSTSDRLAEIILFAGFIFYFSERDQPWLVAAAYLALTGSLMVSYTRARAEALEISCKVGLLTRVERYVVIVISLVFSQPAYGTVFLAIFTYVTAFQRIYHVRGQVKARERGAVTTDLPVRNQQ
jgi:CDP-diacylglycerol--glycerol-3-phosphate 3-phosphatidyltransferase